MERWKTSILPPHPRAFSRSPVSATNWSQTPSRLWVTFLPTSYITLPLLCLCLHLSNTILPYLPSIHHTSVLRGHDTIESLASVYTPDPTFPWSLNSVDQTIPTVFECPPPYLLLRSTRPHCPFNLSKSRNRPSFISFPQPLDPRIKHLQKPPHSKSYLLHTSINSNPSVISPKAVNFLLYTINPTDPISSLKSSASLKKSTFSSHSFINHHLITSYLPISTFNQKSHQLHISTPQNPNANPAHSLPPTPKPPLKPSISPPDPPPLSLSLSLHPSNTHIHPDIQKVPTSPPKITT